MAVTRCPHCSAENHPSAAFCVSCGKALPGQDPLMPRVITESRAAKSELGKGLLSDELKKQLKKATTALLAVCILQLIGGTILLSIAEANNSKLGAGAFVVVYGIALLFFGLFLWARKNPFPAAIVGLVLFVTVHAMDAIADPTAIAKGMIVKIIVIVVLAQAIRAGHQYNNLVRGLSQG